MLDALSVSIMLLLAQTVVLVEVVVVDAAVVVALVTAEAVVADVVVAAASATVEDVVDLAVAVVEAPTVEGSVTSRVRRRFAIPTIYLATSTDRYRLLSKLFVRMRAKVCKYALRSTFGTSDTTMLACGSVGSLGVGS